MTNLDILTNSPAIRAADFLAQRLLSPPATPKHPALAKALLLVEVDAKRPERFVPERSRSLAESYLETAEDLTDSPILDDIEKDDAIDEIDTAINGCLKDAAMNEDLPTLRALAKCALEDRI